jgi:toxin ParE1/3/4
MDWQVVWTEAAFADLEQIVRTAAGHGPAIAESLRVELLESVEVLARFPQIGPTYERDRTGRVREILCRQYRIFYRVIETKHRVEVLTVWHSARREPKLSSS